MFRSRICGRTCGRILVFAAALGAALLPAGAHAQSEGWVRTWGDTLYGKATYPNWAGIKAISAGMDHTLVVRPDSTVLAWGWNGFGECSVPAGLTNVVAVSAGSSISAALKSDGTVVQWGYSDQWTTPQPAGLNNVTAIASGVMHRLALRSDGTVAAWGYTNMYQCDVPADLTDAVAIAAGAYHSLALKSDGTVVAWGYNASGQCDVPAGLTGVKGIAAGYTHSLALMEDGTIVGWGSSEAGSLNIPNLTGVKAISAFMDNNMAIKADGKVVQWGMPLYSLPNVPADIQNAKAIACGRYHSVVLYDLNSAPTANAGGNRTVSADHSGDPDTDVATLTLNGSGSDPDGQTLTYRWLDSESNVVGTEATLPLVLAAGSYTYTLEVEDTYGVTDTDSATVTVNPAGNSAPSVDGPTNTLQGSIGVPMSIATIASDVDGDDLTFSLDAPTHGATIDPATGVVSWTPSALGAYWLTVRATDGYGASGTRAIAVSVSPIVVEGFKATRSAKNIVTVTFNIRNTAPAAVTGVTISSATLRGVNTTTAMPLSIGTLRAGATKKGVKLTFPGASIPSGLAELLVNGTSGAGLVGAKSSIAVP